MTYVLFVHLLLPLLLLAPPFTHALLCNVFSYGAVGDGVHDDTASLQSALAACSQHPSSTTLFPSNGTYLTFGLTVPHPAPDFTIQVEGTLLFSNDTHRWPTSTQACLIVTGGSGVTLRGSGTFNGQGAAWWPCAKAGCPRPDLFLAQGVVNLLIRDLHFLNSPNHNLELYANPQEVYNVTITAPDSTLLPPLIPSHNTDGIDIHGTPAWIHGCRISVGDDLIAIHASDVVVSDCTFGTGHGVSIGSLGEGTALTNISVRDSTFKGTAQALRIKADVVSSGYLTDVAYSDLTLSDCGTTALITASYSAGSLALLAPPPNSSSTLQITNVSFTRVHAQGAKVAGSLQCSPLAPCKGVSMEDVTHTPVPPSGWTCSHVFGASSGTITPPLGHCLEGV